MEVTIMKYLNLQSFFVALLFAMVGIFMLGGCDSGEKVVEKVTGKEDVKEYQKLKKEIGKIADEQAKKYDKAMDELKEGEEKR
jgi:hypothetical protein